MTNKNTLALYLRDSRVPELLNCNRIEPAHSSHCSFFPHLHADRLELFYVAAGDLVYMVDGVSLQLTAGDLVICNQNVVHGDSWIKPRTKEGYLSYSVALTNVSFIGMPENCLFYGNQLPVLKMGAGDSEPAYLFKTLHALVNQEGASNLICQSLALSLLLYVYENLLRQREQVQVHTALQTLEQKQDICTAMRHYMDQNFQAELNLRFIGQTFNASEYHLAHLFKDRYNISPMKYLLKRRLGEAQNQLIDTEYPVALIAESVNAGSPSHFSSMFNKYIGLSPSNYRSQFKHMNAG